MSAGTVKRVLRTTCVLAAILLASAPGVGRLEAQPADGAGSAATAAPVAAEPERTLADTGKVRMPAAEAVDPEDVAADDAEGKAVSTPTVPPKFPALEHMPSAVVDVAGEGESGSGVEDPVPPPDWGSITMLGEDVNPGEKRELVFLSSESFQAVSVKSPVLVIRGMQPGPTLCLTAGVHGDELNGVEIVRRVLEETKPSELRGTIVGVPIVNIQGFERSSRYLPDRRDLNRYFPGRPDGSSAARIAYAFFESVVRHCDALVDLHTGSFHRANMEQVRGDLRNEQVLDLAKAFGTEVVVHNVGRPGTLRRAATEAEIPAIIYEAGEPMRFQRTQIERGVAGIRNLLERLGLTDRMRLPTEKQWIYYHAKWIRVDHGGILISEVRLGDWVRENEILGTVTDPMGRGRSQVVSPHRGRILGMTLAPVVMPGVATFFIGLDTTGPPREKPEEEPDDAETEDERPE